MTGVGIPCARDAPQHLGSAQLRELDIEKDEVVGTAAYFFVALLSVGCRFHFIALELEAFGQQQPDVFCIVNDQHALQAPHLRPDKSAR